MNVVILGASGYTGQVLVKILLNHPKVEQIFCASSSKVGTRLGEDFSWYSEHPKLSQSNQRYISVEDALAQKPQFTFAALPHLASATVAAPFLEWGWVIDLSADFRIKDPVAFNQAYGQKPPRPDLLDMAVYGLSEQKADKIASARLIANPGCYPTSALIPLIPLVEAGLITGPVIINSMSGVSGAGRKAKENLLFSELSEDMSPYSSGRDHRHAIEIEEYLVEAGLERGTAVIFNPHLVPLRQGMLSTITTPVAPEVDEKQIRMLWHNSYKSSPFVRIIDGYPSSSAVRGSNRLDMTCKVAQGQLIIHSAQDNLWKGASGQAVQNMNIILGLAQDTGINKQGDF